MELVLASFSCGVNWLLILQIVEGSNRDTASNHGLSSFNETSWGFPAVLEGNGMVFFYQTVLPLAAVLGVDQIKLLGTRGPISLWFGGEENLSD